MKLHEIVDSLIELSTHEMPDEARQSLDDAIDHIVSNMTEQELHGVLDKTMMDEIKDLANFNPKHVWKEEGDEEEIKAIQSMMEGNIAIA
jgi:hypothetical protein